MPQNSPTLGCQKSLKFEFGLRVTGTSACQTNRHMLGQILPPIASRWHHILRPDLAALSRSHSRERSSLIKDAIVTRIMSCRGCLNSPLTVQIPCRKLAVAPWIGLRRPQVSALTVKSAIIAFAPLACVCAPAYFGGRARVVELSRSRRSACRLHNGNHE